ncbi:MAG TPA: glycoside hydrolase family 16 protein, partial [Bacteroidia bacterium]|nr:glycoside hydrolase family 16 protein [Bacteroidia bacterium]
VLSWEADDHMLKCSDKDAGKNKSTYNYTSGMIYSVNKYQYGYYEIKFRSDKGTGLWPAFWLYAGHENDEIDIFEIKGERNSEIHVDMHCPSGCNNYKTTLGALRKNWGDFISTTAGWHEGFNVVGLEWTPTYIKWYLNGKGIAYWKGNMEAPSAVIANLAIPSNDGPFGPGPDATTKFPASFEIDYIRIWSQDKIAQKESLLEPVLSGSERASLPYGGSRITSKPKPEYKKSILKKESLNVTFSKIENSGFLVSFTGRPNDDFSLEVKDADQNVVYKSADPKIREHHFYITETAGNALLLIQVNGQKIEHRF